MAARKRDYKKEYAQRKAKAIREGYTGYGQKRRVRRQAIDHMMRVLPSHANRKHVAKNVARMTDAEVQNVLTLNSKDIRDLAKTDSLYHYK